jgi:hypothetical protein
VLQLNVGSGDGMVEAYRRPKKVETVEPAGRRESIMFVADEIDTLAALKNRNGSTLSAMLQRVHRSYATDGGYPERIDKRQPWRHVLPRPQLWGHGHRWV